MIKKYNIGIIVSRLDFGAAELLELKLAIELSKLNHNIILMPQYSSDKFNDLEFEKKIHKHRIQIDRLYMDKPIKCLFQIVKFRKLNLDFIISHCRGGDFLSTFITAFTKTKDIKALHAYFEPYHVQSFISYLWVKCLRSANYTYHITNFVLKKNRETFKLNKNKSCLIYNSIDFKKYKNIPTFNKSEYGIPENKKIILSVGRVEHNKGYNNNLDIIIPILKARDDLIYVYAGDNREDLVYFEQINNRIKNNNISHKVFYLGIVNNILGLMSVSNVLLHFANREGFGLVLLEALSMNLNILASNVGGIPEVLEGTNFNPLSILEKDKARKILNQYLDKNIFYANNIDL